MFRKKRPAPGSRPGTLLIDAGAPAPRISVMRYTPESLHESSIEEVSEIPPLLESEGIVWVDVQGLGSEQVLLDLSQIFAIHPLAREDIVNVPQRPKTELYEEHQLCISCMSRLVGSGQVVQEQVTIIFGRDYVISFQERYGDVFDPVRERIRHGGGFVRKSGPDYLAYALLDMIIDAYYPVVELLGERLEVLEESVMMEPTPLTLTAVNDAKHRLLGLRRFLWPQRDAINSMIRDDSPFIQDSTKVFLRDCYDHCVQLGDVVESYREITSGLLSTYLSALSNKTNEVMRVLTVMASLFIPLTFLAGIYGMNFKTMPELEWEWGYAAFWAVMLTTAGLLWWYFARKGWLRGDKAGEPESSEDRT